MNDTLTCVSSPDLSFKLQTTISWVKVRGHNPTCVCKFDIFTWLSTGIPMTISETKLLIFFFIQVPYFFPGNGINIHQLLKPVIPSFSLIIWFLWSNESINSAGFTFRGHPTSAQFYLLHYVRLLQPQSSLTWTDLNICTAPSNQVDI